MQRAPLLTHRLCCGMAGADARNSRGNGRYNLETRPQPLGRTARQARQFRDSQTRAVCRPHRPGAATTKSVGSPGVARRIVQGARCGPGRR